MKKVIAINAGPRINWNTDQLVKEAMKGCQSQGYEVEYIDLYRLDKFSDCISCFGCKLEKTYGKCICHDGLFAVLNKIRNADALIIGSPNYLSDLTAGFRALYERLIFQSLTYNKERPNCNEHMIPVLFITTSNCSEELYEEVGYYKMLDCYKNTLERFVNAFYILTRWLYFISIYGLFELFLQ